MKQIALICFLTLSSFFMHSQTDVAMTITYNGNPVCNYEVTLKMGDVALATGTTDSQGLVVFSGVTLIGMNVDIKAHKGGATEKQFEVNGYIVLNEDYTYELKMEELLKKMANPMMPESVFAESWGLTALDCN